jgi:hypothetical protein
MLARDSEEGAATQGVSEADLAELARRVRRDLPNATPEMHKYALAMWLVLRLLGPEWVRRVIDARTEPDSFVGSVHDKGIENVVHQGRFTELAETMFNLQSVPGFLPHRLTALRNDRRGVEAANLELLAGKFLKRAGIAFEYVRGTGTGKEHELDFHVAGDAYPLEAKLKRPDTVCCGETVRNSLDTARKQLPRGRAGVVFLGIPETWTALIWLCRLRAGRPRQHHTLVDARAAWPRCPCARRCAVRVRRRIGRADSAEVQ